MSRPSPLVLPVLLLGATWIVAAQPLVRVVAVLAIAIVLATVAVRYLARTGLRAILWALLGLLTLAAFVSIAVIRPQLLHTYLPGQLTHAPEVADSRGFYPSEQDAAGNRYAWTQDRATLILDFLVRKPITLTVEMRSAAVAGGPDEPVHVVVNGVDVGQLHPDPTKADFQPLSLRFTPFDWGGEQTEIKLVPTTFQPGKADTRMLGVMVKSITVDKTEAWSSVSRRMWLVWLLPFIAALSIGLLWAMRRSQSPLLGYGVIGLCLLGFICAATFVLLLQRVNVIDLAIYHVWSISGSILALAFALATINIPIGGADTPTVWQYVQQWLIARGFTERLRVVQQRWSKQSSATTPAVIRNTAARRAIGTDLALIFLLALSVRVIWLFVIPPWLAPDEPDHYTYVSHIVEVAQIPHPPNPNYQYYPQEQLTSAGLTLAGELSTGISGSGTRQLPYYLIHYDYAKARDYTAPTKDRLTSAGARATGYPALYYLVAAVPYKILQGAPIVSRLFAVRFTSALFGAMSCIFGYLFAFEIRRQRRWGWALGMCMALMPMYVFDTSVANNDSAMMMFSTALIWLVTRAWLRREVRPLLAFAIGAATGLMLFAKPTGLILAPVAGIILLARVWPTLWATWQILQRRATAIGLYVAGLAAGYGPWLLFRLHYYRDFGIGTVSFAPIFQFLIGVSTVVAAPPSAHSSPEGAPTFFAATTTHSFTSYLHYQQEQGWPYFHRLLIKTFWGDFGWLDTPLPDRIYRVITIFCIIGLIGLALQIVFQTGRRPVLLLIVGIVLAQAITLFLLPDYYASFRTSGAPVGLQGRYFFPVIAPILFLLLSGWDYLLRERPIAVRIAPFVMLLVQGIALSTMLVAYYGVAIG